MLKIVKVLYSILDLLKIQPTHSTHSSAVVILQRPSNPSRLKIIDRSFYHQAPALWNSLPKHLRALSSTSPTQTNYSLLSLSSTQFHKQLKNLPFPSVLSSLDHLLSGLTLWNSTWPDLHVNHTSIPFIIHQHIIHYVGIFISYMMSTVYRNKLTEIHFCQLYVHFKSSSFSHIINLTSFHHMFCDHSWTIVSYWGLY